MATNKIKTFDNNAIDVYDADTFNSSTLLANGYVVNTNITNTPMNTILRGTSLFASAFLDVLTPMLANDKDYNNVNFSYNTTLGVATNYINDSLRAFILDSTAKKVNNSLTLTLNNTAYTYNGEATRNISIYAPTTAGTQDSFLISNGSGNAPTWRATLPMANGGTGTTNIPANTIVVSDGSKLKGIGDTKSGAVYSIGTAILVGTLPHQYVGMWNGKSTITTTRGDYRVTGTITINRTFSSSAMLFMNIASTSWGAYGVHFLIDNYSMRTSGNTTIITYDITSSYHSESQVDNIKTRAFNGESITINYLIIDGNN